MTELSAAGNLSTLPTEVLLNIFTYLPAKEHVRCRQVCTRFKLVLDDVLSNDAFWHEHSKSDFKSVSQIAKRKARVNLWSEIYKSLALWSQLSCATEVIQDGVTASNASEIIQNVEALSQGIIGVHKRRSIDYYDTETLQPTKQAPITGDYALYTEIDDTIIICDFYSHLFVLRKMLNCPNHETNVTFDNVKTFLLVDRLLYYVTLKNKIFVCNLDDGHLRGSYLQQSKESVMCIGHKNNCVHILTSKRNIYSIVNNSLVLSCHLDDHDNILHQVHCFNLLSRLNWRIFFQWMCMLRQKIPDGPLQDTTSVYPYGDVVIVGCYSGALNIYYKPYINGKYDFFNAEPVKQYCFKDTEDCPILKVDVLEVKNGHWIIVAMPKKIAIIKLFHKCDTLPMLPDSEVQRVKGLKITDNS